MHSIAVAGAGIALVLFVPGLLLLFVARVRLSLVELLALAPVCSIGAVFVVAELAWVFHVPFGPPVFSALLAGLAAAFALRWRQLGPPAVAGLESVPSADPDASAPSKETGPRRPRGLAAATVFALVLLLVGIGLGGVTWGQALHGNSTTPPNFDSTQHGFMVARIARAETVAPSKIVVSDPRGSDTAATYYPLGMHAALAIAQRVTGATSASLLNVIAALFAVVMFPLGIYALVRRLIPDDVLPAGFAALLSPLLSLFPYKPITWGGIPLLVSMAMVPVVVVVLARALTTDWSYGAGIVCALAVTSLFAVHNTQALVAVVLAMLLVGEDAWRMRSARVLVDSTRRLGVVGLGAIVLVSPTLVASLGGMSERAGEQTKPLVPLESYLRAVLALHWAVTDRQSWLAALAAVGAVIMLVRRQVAWVVAAVAVLAIGALAATSANGLSHVLGLPWYHDPERIDYNLGFFVPVFGGVALGLGCRLVARPFAQTRGAVAALTAAIVAALVLVDVTIASQAQRVNRATLAYAYSALRPVGADSLAAFNFLGRHAPSRGLVVSDIDVDGGRWMYAFSHVNPLVSLTPTPGTPGDDRSYEERIWLRDHFAALGHDPRVETLVSKYGVHYVYFGVRTIAGAVHTLSLAELRAIPQVHEVWHRGGAYVFELRS